MKTLISLAALLALSAPLSFADTQANQDSNSYEPSYENSEQPVLNSEFIEEGEVLDSSCSYYVKPATCNSHKECKWTGSCVPR
jgi:hypothetical protein